MVRSAIQHDGKYSDLLLVHPRKGLMNHLVKIGNFHGFPQTGAMSHHLASPITGQQILGLPQGLRSPPCLMVHPIQNFRRESPIETPVEVGDG